MRLVIASQNKHKIEEIKPLLPVTCSLVTLESLNFFDEIPETGNTLEANALQKATYIYDKFSQKEKIACFADDTGLEVEALDGRPGVYSARYASLNESFGHAGENKSPDDNIAKLLSELKGIENRKAVFRTVIALVGMPARKIHSSGDKPLFFEGIVRGTITREKRGESGFGYDPVFMPDGYNTTFAQMSMPEKNKLSHRSRAVDGLCRFIKDSRVFF